MQLEEEALRDEDEQEEEEEVALIRGEETPEDKNIGDEGEISNENEIDQDDSEFPDYQDFDGKMDKRFIPDSSEWKHKREKPVKDPETVNLKDHTRSVLTFEVPNGEVYCFSEEFREMGINYTFEYKVLRGDIIQTWINNPQFDNIYSKTTNKDIFTFFSLPGMFTFCFANENFLTLQHKVVYLRLEKSTHDPLFVRRVGEDRPGPFGLEETVCDEIYESLVKIRDMQKDYRLRNEDGRNFAVYLNSRIGYFGPLSTFGILLVGLGQLICLRKLFQQDQDPYTTMYKNKKGKNSAWPFKKQPAVDLQENQQNLPSQSFTVGIM